MRPGVERVEVPRGEARKFRREAEEQGVVIIHENPTTNGKTVFLLSGLPKSLESKAAPRLPGGK